MARRKRDSPRDLPFHRIAQFWNWFPAFRAVAEAGGVNEAARLLHVSPSALSRSVGLLEAALGEPLFYREGTLAPTPYGQRLLAGTRDAMRLIHEATQTDRPRSEPLTFGATSRLGFYRLLPVLHEVRHRWPTQEVRTMTVRDEEARALLLRGQLDLVVVLGVGPRSGLASAPLSPAACHVYCGTAHPLFGEKNPSEASVGDCLFAAPSSPVGTELAVDSWPSDRPRRIGLSCDSLEPAIDACVRGELLACLPEEIVSALGLGKKLRALPRPRLASAALQCLHRPPLGSAGQVVTEIVAAMTAAS